MLLAVILAAVLAGSFPTGGHSDADGQSAAPPDSVESTPGDTLHASPDSTRLPHAANPPPVGPERASTPVGLAWPDTVYLKSGQVLVGRVLQIPGGKITMQVPSGPPGASCYTVTFSHREVLRIGRVRPSMPARERAAGGPIRLDSVSPSRKRFGAYVEGQRLDSYPRIGTEIGYARVHLDLDELERGIQRLYDTNSTLYGHGLMVHELNPNAAGISIGLLMRINPHLGVGVGGIMTGGTARSAATGEVRMRPCGGLCPWLSAGFMSLRFRVEDQQYVRVQSTPQVWEFRGLTWEGAANAFSVGLRFDTTESIGPGLTLAAYWLTSPRMENDVTGNWNEWRPLPGEFPESIRINTLVFTAGLQFN